MVLRNLMFALRWLYAWTVRQVLRATWAWSGATRGHIPPITDSALLQPAHTLALWIRQGKRSSESVVQAFVERALAVNPLLGAVVDQRFQEAVAEAKEVDRLLAAVSVEERDRLASTKPLLGVPFTVKESIKVKGLSNTGGIMARKDVKAEDDADVVINLRKAGGIPLCVTNVPELVMAWETYSNVNGYTCNPYDVSRIAGGSSGGEAALLSAGGTPISVGTDVGGSIRIPSFMCGTFGHKPSSCLVPTRLAGIFPDKVAETRAMVVGPLARCCRDLVLALEAMTPDKARGLQAKVQATDLSCLKIWWAEDLNTPLFSPVDGPVRDGLHTALQYLSSLGAHAAKFTWPLNMDTTLHMWANKLQDDAPGQPGITHEITNKKGAARVWREALLWLVGRSNFTVWTFQRILIDWLMSLFSQKNPDESIHYWKIAQYRFMETMKDNCVLVLPTMPRVAPYHHEPIWNSFDFGFCGVFNTTEMPSTAVPLGLTRAGLPFGIQVVAAPGNDHLSLAVAAALERRFGGWVPPCPVHLSAA